MRSLLRLGALLCCLALLSACSGSSGEAPSGSLQVVTSVYPLAWVARTLGTDRVEVTELTPLGGEAHDATLSAEQRAKLQSADVVLTVGGGFQPEIEAATAEARGTVISLLDVAEEGGIITAEQAASDPHAWLSPPAIAAVSKAYLSAIDAGPDAATEAAVKTSAQAVGYLAGQIDRIAQGECRYQAAVVSHEAFGYLVSGLGVRQIGIEGITPEAEPSADRVAAANEAIASGVAPPIVFYEPTDEGKRVAESVAADVDATLVPLNPLESPPVEGDYVSVMRANIAALRDGLECS